MALRVVGGAAPAERNDNTRDNTLSFGKTEFAGQQTRLKIKTRRERERKEGWFGAISPDCGANFQDAELMAVRSHCPAT